MKKWSSLLVAMLPIWAGIVLYIVEITSSGARVNKQNATKLKVGMAKAEVQAVFGGTPSREDPFDDWWIGYEGCLQIHYDPQGKLAWRQWEELPYRNRFPVSLYHPIQWPID